MTANNYTTDDPQTASVISAMTNQIAELQAELLKKEEEIAQMKADWKTICDAAESMPAGTIEFQQRQEIVALKQKLTAAGDSMNRYMKIIGNLESWQENVLAEITEAPPRDTYTGPYEDVGYLAHCADHWRKLAINIAAKLVEARKLCGKASKVIAEFANDAGDDHSVGVCNCSDTELADKLLAMSKGSVPPTTDSYTTRHEVMNPPESAAMGSEARNLNSANVIGLGEVDRTSEARPADDVPAPCCVLPRIVTDHEGHKHCGNCGRAHAQTSSDCGEQRFEITRCPLCGRLPRPTLMGQTICDACGGIVVQTRVSSDDRRSN